MPMVILESGPILKRDIKMGLIPFGERISMDSMISLI